MYLLIAIIARALKPRDGEYETGRAVIQAQSDGMTFPTTARAQGDARG